MINYPVANKKSYLLLLLAALTNLVTIVAIVVGGTALSSDGAALDQSYLRVTVIDGITELPLSGATVCIPEINSYFSTDDKGVTKTITLPYRPNTAFDDTLKRTWGDITVFVYNEGYADFIIFYIMVPKNATRRLTVTLYPSSVPQTHTLIESPDPNWVQDFVNKYRTRLTRGVVPN